MPTDNIYSYCADYSGMNSCLTAIQELYDRGGLDGHPELLLLIEELDQDAIKRLYARTIILYGIINNIDVGQSTIGGDFNLDFSAIDFSVGLFAGYADNEFSSSFRKITNVFLEFCGDPTITEEQRNYLDEGLSPVLDLFDILKDSLETFGLNPCGSISGNAYRNNSPYIHVQAAGSTGSDGTAAGIHLRWALDGHLGENHLPQGNYLNGEANLNGYRKKNDFVRVYRTPHENRVTMLLDFEQRMPVVDSGRFHWTYLISSISPRGSHRNRVRLRFKDQDGYTALSLVVDPYLDPFAFLTAYEGIVELESPEKSFFWAEIVFRKNSQLSSATLRLEVLGRIKRQAETEEVPVSRKTLSLTAQNEMSTTMTGDNLSKIRFRKEAGSYIKSFEFETYHDFLTTRNEGEWEEVGSGFALSLDNVEVFERLEKEGVYEVDQLWPLYNEGTTVKVANYKDRWEVSRPYDRSLKEVVGRYLELSATDPRASEVIGAIDGSGEPGLEISYVDVINMMAIDYHVARMLGMGHIDTPAGTDDAKWLYRVSYQNRKSELVSTPLVHEYLSQPTAREDFRLPATPLLRSLKYTLGADDENNSEIFDDQGYSKVDRVRVVSIGRQEMDHEKLDGGFWSSYDEDWDVFKQTYPVLYGIEYRPASQVAYVKPEITADESDDHIYYAYDTEHPSGEVPECIPVPDNKDSLFTHFETGEGVHCYAAYAINIFSRASAISDEVSTDHTSFPVNNRLMPPTDISVQYIQEEETLLFTTQREQDWLAGRSAFFPNLDTSFTRVTFNWLDMVDVSEYTDIDQLSVGDIVRADRIKAYFKPDDVFEVRGAIANVSSITDFADQALVELAGYTLINGEQQLPDVPSSLFSGFLGSWLSTPSGLFEILSVHEQNSKISLRIKKQSIISSSETEHSNEFNNDMRMVMPVFGERFSFTENMALASQWQELTKTVELVDLGDPVQPTIETSIDEEGNKTHLLIGGISAGAVISAVEDLNDPQYDLPGYYTVRFELGTSLPPHPQANLPYDPSSPGSNNPSAAEEPHVEWYRGQVRVPYAQRTEERKLIQVLRITSLDPLELVVYDPLEPQDPEAILISANPEDLVQVNFHPGYRAYLFTEPAPAKYNWENLRPLPSENDRKILFSLQSHMGQYSSRISVPTIFLISKIIQPVRLEDTISPWLRVRPDDKGRAAFTFDRKILPDNGAARNPFGLMFFRISSIEILEALYAPATVETILAVLAGLEEDPHADLRFNELANLVHDPDNPGHFRVFDALPSSYGFPVPDRQNLVVPGDNHLQKLEKYRAALRAELLPLTEQPPILAFIKQGRDTENAEPVIRDLDGNMLAGNDARFNPFPMVRKFTEEEEPNVTYIRFTDYSLRGSSRFLYFYTAAEITNQLIIGPLSSYTGPVGVLHTAADIAPNVLGHEQLLGQQRGVRFWLAPLPEPLAVEKIRLFRSTSPNMVSPLSNLEHFLDVGFEVDDRGSIMVTDDLVDVGLGNTVYFRLATVRTIINESGEEEGVVSKLSEIVSVNLVDTLNPEAPQLFYTDLGSKLTWEPTVAHGNYYLYRQNVKGNWQKVATFEDSNVEMEHAIGTLNTTDEDGNRIYHRFKVRVQNASGLFNLLERELTI